VSSFDLSIGDLVARTGVSEPTLRMWERRHGFPTPKRTERGHRRYSAEQAKLVERVVAGRRLGLPLELAISRAESRSVTAGISLFATLRRARPELAPHVLGKRELIVLSHAIEDEVLSRGETQLMFATFQREVFYRKAQQRWQELSECASASAVFADFKVGALPESGPAEIPVGRRRQLAREWSLVFYGGRSSIAFVAREAASSNVLAASHGRNFEILWTVDPKPVRELAEQCVTLAAASVPELGARAAEALLDEVTVAPSEQAELTAAILSRTLSLLR
jgi:DICT domain-containing protein